MTTRGDTDTSTVYCGAYRNQHKEICLVGMPDGSLDVISDFVNHANIDDPDTRFFVVYTDATSDGMWWVLG